MTGVTNGWKRRKDGSTGNKSRAARLYTSSVPGTRVAAPAAVAAVLHDIYIKQFICITYNPIVLKTYDIYTIVVLNVLKYDIQLDYFYSLYKKFDTVNPGSYPMSGGGRYQHIII